MKEFKEFKLFSEGGNNSEEVVMLLFVCVYIYLSIFWVVESICETEFWV